MFGKPTGVVLLVLFVLVAALADFGNGGLMLLGDLPIPAVYSALGTFYGALLLFGGMIGLCLIYGMWNLKSWARIILQIGFPAQVIFNIILDPAIFENYFLLALSIIIAIYLQLPSTREHFS
ncbi:MAG: hypothetical protein JSW61_12000 [Candidatus Thorarchaeota archaeon]|nr:MAG: hypothetical protein JSW61_12000 [Candidatus Thorarchaeota archaeon]